jgi:SPP1 family predicted phage head-tail adaptor
MDSGKRDKLISIEQAVSTQDPVSGTESLDWHEMARPWANVRTPNGSEVFRAEQQVAKVNAIFNVRFREDVTPTETFRIVYEGRTYDITAVVQPLGAARRTEIELYGFARAEAPPE